MTVTLEPVAFVEADRKEALDDFWGGSESRIVLADGFDDDALAGIEEFSHAEIIYSFHRVSEADVTRDARHPRGNRDWPRVGIFAQRGKNRPNRIGSTIVRIVAREPRALRVAELDAIDGTPVLDIKPVIAEFLPREDVREPEWCRELMRDYWKRR